jgi:SAM-dependent methyltransferase
LVREDVRVGESDAEHWDQIYSTKTSEETSWHQPRPETSLRLLDEAVARTGSDPGSIVDVGAGTSTLAEELASAGWSPVTVLDLSATAVHQASERIGGTPAVRFVVADVLEWSPEVEVDAWHDRAVFHFLTDPEQQRRYVETAARAVRAGGVLVVGTFGPHGPQQCSGLPVTRHDAASLRDRFAPHFDLLDDETVTHRTPWGADQEFVWVTLRRRETP